MPASHDRMTTAVRSASGPPPVSHGRTTSHCSTGDRAKPASHSLRRQSGRPVVGRIAGPYRHCHAVGRTRAGHVHAGRIADGVNSRGAALCASRLAPCGVSWASTRCRIASGPRPRRHGDTGPSAPTHHQPPSLGRPSPTQLPSAGARPFKLGYGAPVGTARAYHHSGRPSRPAHAIRQRRGGASARPPPTHPATGPLTPAHCACNVTRRRLGRAGPTGPRRAGRAPSARAERLGPVITALSPRHHSGLARGSLCPLVQITPGPPGNPLNPAPGVNTQLWTFSRPSTCRDSCP
jgi:hypothetical protein